MVLSYMVFVYFRNGTLDLLIADTPVLDYYRATDHGCKLQRVGDHALMEDTYAIGMAKGFPLKVKSHHKPLMFFIQMPLWGHNSLCRIFSADYDDSWVD